MVRRKGIIFDDIKDVVRETAFPLDRVDSRRRFVLIYFVRLCFLVGRRLWKDRCQRQAAALAYQTVLSLVPLLAVVVAIASTLRLDEYQDQVTLFLQRHLLPEAANTVGHRIIELASGIRLKALGIVGGVSLFVLAITLLLTIEKTTNEIFRCGKSRRFVVRIAAALGLLILAPAAFGLSLYFTGELVFLPRFVGALTPLGFTTLTLFLCYWLLPHTRVRVVYSAISALVAGVLLEALKIGFAFYATYLGGTLSYVYGTFAILPLAMIWIYLTWIIFLFGAEFSAALHEVERYDRLDG
jgi:membrane protein